MNEEEKITEAREKYKTLSDADMEIGSVKIHRPFGPMILQARWPQPYIDYLNEYQDKIVEDEKLRNIHDNSARLAGNLRYEMRMKSDVWNHKPDGEEVSAGEWAGRLCLTYIKVVKQHLIENSLPKDYLNSIIEAEGGKERINDLLSVKNLNIIEGWINDQYAGDFNPVHKHGGSLSSVTFLKIPDSIKNMEEKDGAGYLTFLDGRTQTYTGSSIERPPAEGIIYLFPNWLLHSVYPFRGEGLRRSMSFNVQVTDSDSWSAIH